MSSFSLNLLILFTMIYLCISPISADGITCFKCYASQPVYNTTNLLCSQFDGSKRFQVFCPYSTLCMKKTVYYRTKTSVTTAVLRDCARQKRTAPTYNEHENKWYNEEEVVKTAYEERCFTGEVRGSDAPEYCFCSYHLCNSIDSNSIPNSYTVTLLTLILITLHHREIFFS